MIFFLNECQKTALKIEQGKLNFEYKDFSV